MKRNKLSIVIAIGVLMIALVVRPLVIQASEPTTGDSQVQIDNSSEQFSAPSSSSSSDADPTDDDLSTGTTTSETPDVVASLEVSVSKSKITIGQTVQVATIVLPSTAEQKLQYNSSNSAVASIDSQGKVTGLATGQTEITVTSQDGLKTAKLTMTVVKTSVVYQSHIQNIGWQKTVTDGALSGTQGKALRLEGVKVKLDNATYAGHIEYQVHIQGIGWQSKVSNGAMAGTSGQARRLEAIKLLLTDELSSHYDVYYRVHVQNVGWLSWAKNGATAGSQGLSARMEGIEIKLVPKGMGAFEQSRAFVSGTTLSYQTHIQGIGWQASKGNNQISGTTGQGKRIEALKVSAARTGLNGSVIYQTHVQNIGWQAKASNGAMAGTTGQGKQVEAINISLTGELASFYDIYYRVHVQDKGWLAWTKNGGNAGSSGAAKRLEALQIQLVPKGAAGPATGKAFLSASDFKPKIGKPYYYSQLDPRWSGNRFNLSTIGSSGCVPTSLAMILKGSYGMNLTPADVAARMDYYSGWSFGASGKDLIATAKSYGHAVEVVTSQGVAEQRLREGYPLIWLENVGIGHAVVSFGNRGGSTEVFDPYDRQFFNGWYSISYLWSRPSADTMDWDAGRPVFVIK
ncbi:hypothetical protein FACS1894192_05680 [Bacilli bacterium]|nr:hypothetical protein FACS1894192_05680 [Bacilli bacterium]